MINDDLKAQLAAHLGINFDDPNFWPLIECTLETLKQVTTGKGRERHARGRDFVDQPILALPRLLGEAAGLGGLLYQMMKKGEEALKLPKDRQVAELRGAVIYALAAVMHAQSFAAPSTPTVQPGVWLGPLFVRTGEMVRVLPHPTVPEALNSLLARVSSEGPDADTVCICFVNGEPSGKFYNMPRTALEPA